MSNPRKVAKEASERAERAAARAEEARARAERLQQQQRGRASNLGEAVEELRTAELRELHAKEDARAAHKQAADALEERAEDLAAHGDTAGAERARDRADGAREREDHT
jgi:hypothetical protein